MSNCERCKYENWDGYDWRRTFKQLHQAEKWLERNGYKCKDK